MSITFRSLNPRFAAGIVACLGVCGFAQAQPDFPSRPIRLVIGFAPGGPSDIIARAIALKMPQVKAGRVRALAVTTAKRSPALPDVPTMAEAGFPNAGSDNWLGALVPAGTPKDVIGKLHAAFVKALNAPETREYLAAQGADVIAAPPEQFSAFLRQEFANWEKVIRATKIRAD